MSPRLSDFSTLTFDCYGTLIDWETGIWDALQPLLARDPDRAVTRARVLSAFGELERDQETATPSMVYEELLAAVHRRLADRFGLPTDDGADGDFGASVPHWPAFPDSACLLYTSDAADDLVSV